MAAALREAIAGPVDVVIDPVFGAAATAAAQVLGEGGRLVNLGGAAGDQASFSSATLRSRSISVLGYTNNSLSATQRAQALTSVAALASDGKLSVAHTAQPLDRVADAWLATAAGRAAPRWILLP
jgi:NADPH:quinone reductase-like Zn-dependent oxidoreductase